MSSDNARWWREQAEAERKERTQAETHVRLPKGSLEQLLLKLILDAEVKRSNRVNLILGPTAREWRDIVRAARELSRKP